MVKRLTKCNKMKNARDGKLKNIRVRRFRETTEEYNKKYKTWK